VIANRFYLPYFIEHFQGIKLEYLRTDKTGPTDPKPFVIFLIPASGIPSVTLDHWRKADEAYREIDFEEKNKRSFDLWAGFLESHFSSGNPFPEDPFLTAVYWEKMGFLKFLDAYFIQATEAYRNAIQRGVPAAHLYYDLGVCLKIQNRLDESNRCFEKAASLSKNMD
jgi:tetratricopeptide (TPR) repeat protein